MDCFDNHLAAKMIVAVFWQNENVTYKQRVHGIRRMCFDYIRTIICAPCGTISYECVVDKKAPGIISIILNPLFNENPDNLSRTCVASLSFSVNSLVFPEILLIFCIYCSSLIDCIFKNNMK